MQEDRITNLPAAQPIDWIDIQRRLAEPFEQDEVKFLPKGKELTQQGDILAIPFIDAQTARDRLDEVVGMGGWSFTWDPIDTGDRMRIRGMLRIHNVERWDAGEAYQEEEPLKSAVSDALKRCAAQAGIGGYLRHVKRIYVKGKMLGPRVAFADEGEPGRKLAEQLKQRGRGRKPKATDTTATPTIANKIKMELERVFNGERQKGVDFLRAIGVKNPPNINFTDEGQMVVTELQKQPTYQPPKPRGPEIDTSKPHGVCGLCRYDLNFPSRDDGSPDADYRFRSSQTYKMFVCPDCDKLIEDEINKIGADSPSKLDVLFTIIESRKVQQGGR